MLEGEPTVRTNPRQIAVRMPDELWERLLAESEATHLSISDLVRLAVIDRYKAPAEAPA